MKIMRVQYTVVPEFVETNKQNITKVMDKLRSIGSPGVRYSSYLLEDGKTFMHYVIMQDEAANKVILDLEEFKHFQSELKASRPEVPPKAENLSLVGSSYDILN